MNRKNDDIAVYIEDQEYIANSYVMRCYGVTMIVYTIAFILNLVGIFVIEDKLMWNAFIASLIIYIIVFISTKFVSLSNKKIKYFILFSIVMMFTITGVCITYHVVVVPLLPFLYATLYSSKKTMRYVYVLTVISTIIIVYGGYYYGLCDANMVLLTTDIARVYIENGQFLLSAINPNPQISLLLFFVIPRCLIYVAFMTVCSRLYDIVSGSLEKAKLTAELEKAKIEAESANMAKTQFLARMSHEIRTPINAVMGMNEMILRESEESTIREYAEDVKNTSLMLLNIINEILDSSKIESSMMEIVAHDYEMGSMLNDLYNMISIKAGEKKLELVFDIDSSIPNGYFGDDQKIRQVLLNLLTNAVKYTNQGTVTLKVRGRLEEENAVLRFSVKDTGIGIRKEDIGKIYDAFQRFDVLRNRNVEGSGLGMNIVQQLLKLMGSELQIESEYEKGSEFSFDIVQKVIDTTPLGDFRERLRNATADDNYQTPFIAPKARVLIVDDYQMNLKVFKNLLKQTQMQIYEAESGKACLEMLEHSSFDIIFLDHMMPEMDGIEVLHAIRNKGLCVGVPIIMLTANAIVGNREKFIQEGFDDFLSKPITPDKLDKVFLRYLPRELITVCESGEAPVVVSDAESSDAFLPSLQFQRKELEALYKRLPEIDYMMGMTTCSGDEDFYLELLQDFVCLSIKEELVRYLDEKDYKNYNIRIHGFKNNAYSIGAKEMGDLALDMEIRTRSGLPEEINGLQKQLFEYYDRICLEYNGVIGSR